MVRFDRDELERGIDRWEASAVPFAELAQQFPIRAKIMGGLVHPRLTARVAETLGLAVMDTGAFYHPNGEFSCRLRENVRQEDVILINPVCRSLEGRSPNDAIKETRLLIDAASRASVNSITAVITYLGYQKQERKVDGRQPISARDTVDEFVHRKVETIIIVDLHAPAIQGFFPSELPVDNLLAERLFAREFKRRGYVGSNYVVVAPDSGGMDRAVRLASQLDAGLAFIWKKRNKQTGVIEDVKLVGDVRGRHCILPDDMVQSGGTLIKDAKAIKDADASSVIACATHADFTNGAVANIRNSIVEELMVTDTLPLAESDEVKTCEQITVLPIHELISEAIWRHHHALSISSMFR